MANAYKCDRCGSFYTPYFVDVEQSLVPNANSRVSANGISITRRMGSIKEHYEMDLCPVCMDHILAEIFVNKFKYDDCSDIEDGA